MSHRIIFDGLNLSLRRGTGIATYTRILTHAAHDLGHEVGVVYSTPFTPAKNQLLREIAFFDEKRAAMSGKRNLTLRRPSIMPSIRPGTTSRLGRCPSN